MEDFSRYEIVGIHMPYYPLIKKIVSVPGKTVYINLSAAPEANIIRLVQSAEETIYLLTEQ